LRVAGGAPADRVERLLTMAEWYCIVTQTLRAGVPVEFQHEML